MKTNLSLFILLGCLLLSSAHGSTKRPLTIYFTPSPMASSLLAFFGNNDLKVPVTIKNVSSDKKFLLESTDAGKKCGLKGVMLNAYPLLVSGKDCIVNDVNIMDYLQEKFLVKILK